MYKPDYIKKKWVEYFKKLLNPVEALTRSKVLTDPAVEPSSIEEAKAALCDQKLNVAPAFDGIPTELSRGDEIAWKIFFTNLFEKFGELKNLLTTDARS